VPSFSNLTIRVIKKIYNKYKLSSGCVSASKHKKDKLWDIFLTLLQEYFSFHQWLLLTVALLVLKLLTLSRLLLIALEKLVAKGNRAFIKTNHGEGAQ